MSKVAVLGLGTMGSRMAHNLLKAGNDVVVYNRTRENAAALEAAGAKIAESPREAAEQSEITVSMVTDIDASRTIWLDAQKGAIHGLRPGSIAIESSTLTPDWIRKLGDAVVHRSAEFLDAPVVGSKPHAESAQLMFLIGGAETLEKARRTLLTMGTAIHHVGPMGAGSLMKLAVNALLGIQVAALGEILGLIRKSGIDEKKGIEILNAMPTASPALQRIAGIVSSRSFAPNFPIRLVEKDFSYAVTTAEHINTTLPASIAVRDVYARAIRDGLGEGDISGVVQLYD